MPLDLAAANARGSHTSGRCRKNDFSAMRGKVRLPILPLTAQCMEEPLAKRLLARLSFNGTQIERRHLVPALHLFELLRQARDNMDELAAQSIPSKEYRPCCFFSAE